MNIRGPGNTPVSMAITDDQRYMIVGNDRSHLASVFDLETFETQAPHLQWLTRAIFVGTGERHPNDVIVRVWKVE